jgi:hypothetical protein
MKRLQAAVTLLVFVGIMAALAWTLDAIGWKFALGAMSGFVLAQIGFRLQYGFWHQGY